MPKCLEVHLRQLLHPSATPACEVRGFSLKDVTSGRMADED